jgi:hypothetical protein
MAARPCAAMTLLGCIGDQPLAALDHAVIRRDCQAVAKARSAPSTVNRWGTLNLASEVHGKWKWHALGESNPSSQNENLVS